MTADPSFRKHLVQYQEEVVHYHLLFCGAIVLVFASQRRLDLSMTSFGADTDGVSVVSCDVAAFLREWPTVVQGAVSANKEMIARILAKAASFV